MVTDSFTIVLMPLQEMCFTFWPLKRSEPKEFSDITVCLEEKEEQDNYNKYHLTVTITVRTS